MVSAECKQQGIEQKDFRFSRREIREATCWGNTQLKVHLGRLEEIEYLLIHRGSRGQSYLYELLYDGDGQDDKHCLMGLLDTEKLQRRTYDEKKSGVKIKLSGAGRPQVGGESDKEKRLKPLNGVVYKESGLVNAEKALGV